jgi:hypothetical protein
MELQARKTELFALQILVFPESKSEDVSIYPSPKGQSEEAVCGHLCRYLLISLANGLTATDKYRREEVETAL